ncbi:acriflavine resistance protein B [Gordoniibacillus kamchatkensis]|uniref:Acriflavine resistance protein B n=1 Tax=Gordoniibacillus kamchatkensis TaxID=1590651 RepID=A0ABR5AGZ5_9BACL|nr:efflux RND transporter permease subunit [Paenibacillus sp. VKM B-2647]KIL40277.1 acriflavine resistance protein B [Paenibacillus sp. VKM B-2647]
MNKLITASMNRIVLVVTCLALILVWGGMSAYRMQRDYLPPINNPSLLVTAQAPDYEAEQIQASVLGPFEDAVRKVDGLESMETNSFDGGLLIGLHFPFDFDMRRAESDVTRALDRVSLPVGVGKPSVTRVSSSSFPVIKLSLTSPSGKMEEAALRTTVQAQIAAELKSLPGVSDVRATGAAKYGYALTLRMADLGKNGITVDDVKQSLTGIQSTWMQGSIANSRVTIPLQVPGLTISEQELKQLPVRAADGHTVPLSAVADLSESMLDVQTITRTDGAASVFFDVLKTPSAGITEVSHNVRSRIQDVPGVKTGDIKLSVLFDQGEQVRASLYGLVKEGLLGCLLSMACVFLFFRNVRSTALIALSLPVCLTAATGLLHAMGISLNILTVSGLIVAMGRVIDDTIVVLDNIHRKIRESHGRATSALIAEAAGEMIPAIASSTATTVAVYIPIAFVRGMIGAAFSGFAWSIVIALLTSLLVAVFVVPAFYCLGYGRRANDSALSIEPIARKLLSGAFRRRRAVIAVCVLLFVLSGVGAWLLPVNFLPANRSGQINVQLEFPEGTALTQLDAAVKRMEQALKPNKDIASFSSVLGSSFTPQFDDVFDAGGGWIQSESVANIAISVTNGAELQTVIDQLQTQLAGLAGSAAVTVTNQNIAGDDSQLKIELSGADAAALDAAARLIRSKLQHIQGLSVAGAVNDKEALPRFRLALDRAALDKAGIRPEDVYERIRIYLSEGARIDVNAGHKETVPLAIHTDKFALAGGSPAAADPQTQILTLLGQETFQGRDGRTFRLNELASLSPASAPSVIQTREGRPFSVVTANITARDVEKIAGQVKDLVDGLPLPAGIRHSINGISAQVDQMIYETGIALAVSCLLVLFILSLVFKGWRAPLTVLICIPFAYTGSVVGMAATGGEWNLASLVGLLMLSGIAATNGIVLVDKIERNLAGGLAAQEAILQGAASRVRPVLMTAVTTVLTLLPLIFLGNSDAVISRSLGIVVVCGMISSTLISLLIIPVIYDWICSPKVSARVAARYLQTE